ncbi:MAG TPA: hypothetical protein VGH23_12735 [Rhizomicrobium sp.]|jgi:hypothetical protein
MEHPITGPNLQIFNSRAMPWEECFIPELGKSLFAKRFLEDPETGVTVRLVKYPAGFTNTWHTHPCAHGMSRPQPKANRIHRPPRPVK